MISFDGQFYGVHVSPRSRLSEITFVHKHPPACRHHRRRYCIHTEGPFAATYAAVQCPYAAMRVLPHMHDSNAIVWAVFVDDVPPPPAKPHPTTNQLVESHSRPWSTTCLRVAAAFAVGCFDLALAYYDGSGEARKHAEGHTDAPAALVGNGHPSTCCCG